MLPSQMMASNHTWKFSFGTKTTRRLWSLCPRLRRRCEIQGRNRRDSGRPCYGCGGYGHSHATCPIRRRYEWSPPSRRRPNPSFINDVHKSLSHASIALFADDAALSFSSSSLEDLQFKLKLNLKNVAHWLEKNKLTLNTSKSKFMLIADSKKLKDT